MNDYVSLLPATLQWVSAKLSSVSRVPWPLWIGILFPVYVAAVSCVLWFLRGRVWAVRCAYPKTTRNRPCNMWVVGEWARCRHHNSRRRYSYGHVVNPRVRRWETISKNGTVVDTDERGTGVFRLRPGGSTLLYERGFARPWQDAGQLVPKYVSRTYRRLRQMRWSIGESETSSAVVAGELAEGALREDIAAGLTGVVQATRFATVAFGVGLVLSIVAIVLLGPAQAAVQYAATLSFVLAWAAISSGAYQRRADWLHGACLKALKWWVLFFVPVAVINLAFTIFSAPAGM